MIEIKDEHYIAEGLERKCYHHPENKNLCVKVGQPTADVKHLYYEIKYYHRIRRKNINKYEYPFYVKYHGEVETNMGTGFVYDLIKDETTNKVSLTLRHYLEMENSPISDKQIVEELDRLKQQMTIHKVFVGDLRARNICCKFLKDGSVQFIVIDGIGHRDFFPFADWFHYFAKKKVERRFIKANLHSLSAQRSLLKKMRDAGETII